MSPSSFAHRSSLQLPSTGNNNAAFPTGSWPKPPHTRHHGRRAPGPSGEADLIPCLLSLLSTGHLVPLPAPCLTTWSNILVIFSSFLINKLLEEGSSIKKGLHQMAKFMLKKKQQRDGCFYEEHYLVSPGGFLPTCLNKEHPCQGACQTPCIWHSELSVLCRGNVFLYSFKS